MDAKIFVLQ